MSRAAICLSSGLVALLASPCLRAAEQTDAVVHAIQQRTVKIIGGAIGQTAGYGSGVIVAPDGQIVTVLSSLLEARSLRVILADGQRYRAEVVRQDPLRQLALLQIDARDLPFAAPAPEVEPAAGDWVLFAGNPFKVAAGAEPVTVALTTLSGWTEIDARRRVQAFPYRGRALLTDYVTSTPGSAGGGLFDLEGRLIGIIGRAVIGLRTNTWLNYALPAGEVAAFLAGEARPEATVEAARESRAYLGIQLFDLGGEERPAFVERVHWDSPARVAGLRANDLIVSFDGEMIESCDSFERRLAQTAPEQTVNLVVKRGEDLVPLRVTLGAQP